MAIPPRQIGSSSSTEESLLHTISRQLERLTSVIASSGGGSSYTFTNGLTNTAGVVKLGGVLTENTNITGNFPLGIYTNAIDISIGTDPFESVIYADSTLIYIHAYDITDTFNTIELGPQYLDISVQGGLFNIKTTDIGALVDRLTIDELGNISMPNTNTLTITSADGIEINAYDSPSGYFYAFTSSGELELDNNGATLSSTGVGETTIASSTGVFLNGNGLVTTLNSKHQFTTSSTFAGINTGSFLGDPSGLSNGDIWYNATTHKFRGRANGVSIDLH